MKTYTIAPLKWLDQSGDWSEEYRAFTCFGNYHVICSKGEELAIFNQWRWGFCFDEYYDEDDKDCDSLKDGKRLAQEHWEERLKSCLVEKKSKVAYRKVGLRKDEL